MKQGSANTIAIVQESDSSPPQMTDLPKGMKVNAIFGQDTYIKAAVEVSSMKRFPARVLGVAHDLIFLGSFRSTIAIFLIAVDSGRRFWYS